MVLALLSGCASARQPVPVGYIPEQQAIDFADEEYGQTVLGNLLDRYMLSNDDQAIMRVERIVQQLTTTAKADRNPWHVHVLSDDAFKNAAATRGNHIFVWTGILKQVKNDDELAAILAHEIGHVLAGHTASDPSEEVNGILSGVAGSITSSVLSAQGGGLGLAADLAGVLVQEGMKALIINPEQQRKEFEADTLGLFLMADAGFDPMQAAEFWRYAENHPEFGANLGFLSSHPSSQDRLKQIEELLPIATRRYQAAQAGDSFVENRAAPLRSRPRDEWRANQAPARTTPKSSVPIEKVERVLPHEVWRVEEPSTAVHEAPEERSMVVGTLPHGSKVSVRSLYGRWLKINEPIQGYVRSWELAPDH